MAKFFDELQGSNFIRKGLSHIFSGECKNVQFFQDIFVRLVLPIGQSKFHFSLEK